jgi:hypothetical protein
MTIEEGTTLKKCRRKDWQLRRGLQYCKEVQEERLVVWCARMNIEKKKKVFQI